MARSRVLAILAAALVVVLAGAAPAAAIRIKDMASVRGVRHNQLIGYGLVVGLNGTGDKTQTTFTTQGLANMLTRMGVRVTADQIKVKNVAAVIVTADLPAYARLGNRLDVTLSSAGDATSLAGGTLVLAPLKGIDGQVYAVAQGPVSVGGFQAGGAAATVSKNHPTVGRIPRGAVVEREVPLEFGELNQLTINLHAPDFTTASRVADRINQPCPSLGPGRWTPPRWPSRCRPRRRATRWRSWPAWRPWTSSPTSRPRWWWTSAPAPGHGRGGQDQHGGGGQRRAFHQHQRGSRGQPAPALRRRPDRGHPPHRGAGGRAEQGPQAGEGGVSIGEVVKALNALGATPRDLITILQAIKAAGALQADLEII